MIVHVAKKFSGETKMFFLQRKLKLTKFLCSRFDLIERFPTDFVLHLFRNNVAKLLLGHLYEYNLLEIKWPPAGGKVALRKKEHC